MSSEMTDRRKLFGDNSEDTEYRILFARIKEIQSNMDEILEILSDMNDVLKDIKEEKGRK